MLINLLKENQYILIATEFLADEHRGEMMKFRRKKMLSIYYMSRRISQ